MTVLRLKYVDRFTDRHGRVRHYFRRPGGPRVALLGEPGSDEFMEAYRLALASEPAVGIKAERLRGEPGTVARLVSEYLASMEFVQLKATSKRGRRGIAEAFARAHGHRLFAQMQREHIGKILAAKVATPGAANNLLKTIRALVRFAVANKWRADDPTIGMKQFRLGEFHTWTEEEIALFEAHWPLGTRERTAFAMHLYTGQRKSDVVRMTWRAWDRAANSIAVVQEKTGARLDISMHPRLREALEAWPQTNVVILVTSFGKPFTVNGYGNWVRDMIDEAGLPKRCSSHGVRKAASRRLAEAGCTEKEIQSITGHVSLAEVARYTKAANQKRLAKAAVTKLQFPTDGG